MISAATALAVTFNLVCTGTTETTIGNSTTVSDHTVTFRIDLARERFCQGECVTERPIADVQPSILVLEERRVDDIMLIIRYRNAIDRWTGRQTIVEQHQRRRVSASALSRRTDARCEVSAFTGMPGTPPTADSAAGGVPRRR